MESTSVFNLYSYDRTHQVSAAGQWAQQLREKIDPLNSSAERMSVLFDPVLRTVARSFLVAGELDESLKADIGHYEAGNYPPYTVSRIFEVVALDICKEIISDNDITIAATSISNAPKQALRLLNDAYPQAA